MSLQIQIRRNEVIESRHEVMAIMMNHKDEVLQKYSNSADDFGQQVFPRSAVKFAQAIAFVQSGAIEKFGLGEKHIAIACASHSSEKFHTELVSDWLKRMGEGASSLECGPHYPSHEETLHQMIKAGEKATPLHNNCSGKHSGMIAASKVLGFESKSYSHYDHPIQKRIRNILSEITDFDFEKSKWGVDGCGIPTYAIPLQVIAKMMSALLPQRKDHPYVTEAEKIVQAIQKYPEYISGTNEYCTEIVKVTKGKILAKTGAEGVYVALDVKRGLSLVLKARDGQSRASRAALLWFLRKQDWISDDEFNSLKNIGLPPIRNWAGLSVGDIQVQEL